VCAAADRCLYSLHAWSILQGVNRFGEVSCSKVRKAIDMCVVLTYADVVCMYLAHCMVAVLAHSLTHNAYAWLLPHFAGTMQRLESGDLKLRVRALDAALAHRVTHQTLWLVITSFEAPLAVGLLTICLLTAFLLQAPCSGWSLVTSSCACAHSRLMHALSRVTDTMFAYHHPTVQAACSGWSLVTSSCACVLSRRSAR
jgi:hypothetical protein